MCSLGVMRLVQGKANPYGAADAAVYLLHGDATAGPITRIVPAAGGALPVGTRRPNQPVRIKLLHLNDLHGRIAVLSRLAAWLQAMRRRHAADPHVIVLAVTTGDESGGHLSDLLLGHSLAAHQTHPGYRLLSLAGIDLGVPGNHDLDLGTATLARACDQEASFPVLAANVTDAPALAERCPAAVIVVARGVRIGCIGLTTPGQVHPEPYSRRRIADPVTTAAHLLPALRPLCDVLIVLSHLGLSLNQRSAVVSAAGDVELARSLPPGGVHLIVGGHTHSALNEAGLSAENIVNGIPIGQAGKFGQFVGEVEIHIGDTVEVVDARLHPTLDLPNDALFEQAHVQPLLAQIEAQRQRVLGSVAADADLSADAVRTHFAAGESALANFIADALVYGCRAAGHNVDLAIVDASSVHDGLQPGQVVTLGDWFGVMPFPDVVCLLRLTGRQLEALVRDNALRVERPGEPHTERGFLHFSAGVRYAIRLGPTREMADAEGITVDGRPIAAWHARDFVVAAASFLRGPAAVWEAHVGGRLPRPLFDLMSVPRAYTGLRVRDLLLDHIAAQGGILPESGARRDGRVRVLT